MRAIRPLLWAGLLACSQASHAAAPDADPLAGVEELADFMATSLAAQRVVHSMLDYCATEMGTRGNDALQAKDLWNSRNLAIVGASGNVARAWYTAAGIPTDQISGLVTSTMTSIANAAALNHPEQRAVAAVAAGAPEDRLRACSAFSTEVNRGTQDLRVISPKTYAFYQKYAPRKP